MHLKLRECNITDLKELQKISFETYHETFKEMCSEEVMQNYAKKAFDIQKIHQELNNKNSKFFFLYCDNLLSGYIKINEYDAQHALKSDNYMELERIYVKKDFQGIGLGKYLLKKTIQIAKENAKKCLWLSVWEKNKSAIEFYKKFGFEKICEHDFYMGNERQNDHILALELQ
jgi:ribosomal protein S18 acetylase RimI-like enzyme